MVFLIKHDLIEKIAAAVGIELFCILNNIYITCTSDVVMITCFQL